MLDDMRSYNDGTRGTADTDYYSCANCVDIYDVPNHHNPRVFTDQFTIPPVVATMHSSMVVGGQCGSACGTPMRSHTTLYEDPGCERIVGFLGLYP